MDPRRELALPRVALQFLTRLPVSAPFFDGALAASARYFSIVGLIVGALSAVPFLFAPAPIAALLALAIGALITGGLHEDGLSDTVDGLGGGADRDRALAIMRDSRVGAYGAMALIFSVALRAAPLMLAPQWAAISALILAHGAGRALMVWPMALMAAARTDGRAKEAGDASLASALLGMIPPVVLALWAFGAAGALALAVAGLCAGLLCWRLHVRLGGYTGDGLGAVEQVGEIAVLLTLGALLS